jgi:hypothetical protein
MSISASYAGNVPQTSSYSIQSLSASYAGNVPQTSSYAIQALSSSYAGNVPQTSSYSLQSATSSYVSTSVARESLSAAITYYVNPTGSNSNGGLTTATAFQTIQYAVNKLNDIDVRGNRVTIQLTDGTYYETNISLPIVTGATGGGMTLQGNSTTPSNTTISGSVTRILNNRGVWAVQHLKLDSPGQNVAHFVTAPNGMSTLNNIEFGNTLGSYITSLTGYTYANGKLHFTGSGTVYRAFEATMGAMILINNIQVTCSNPITFSGAFAATTTGGMIDFYGATFKTGSVSGSRYFAMMNGGIVTLAGADALPGNVAGSTSTGGQYI